ncbi:hypothetical protein Zm00014a_026044 [Zea mays]|uniref:Uncharacterized protein n=1 Tax=Zea mays TaxID=4577 RepID=A0A3L6FKU9_MAIZE|nr:hypothetical protein Zm00014a_026044 [Zea mays]
MSNSIMGQVSFAFGSPHKGKGNAKVSKFKKKPFLLYEYMSSLYAGSTTDGDLNLTSTEPPNKRAGPLTKRSHSKQSTQNTVVVPDSNGINFAGNGTNPFPQIMGLEMKSAPSNLNQEEQEDASGKKRKQTQTTAKLVELLEFRKNHIEKSMKEKKEKEDDYCVEKCIDVVDSMKDLTDEQKADANELFQSEMNRRIFMKTKNLNVRLIWLKKKISQVFERM